MFFLSEIAKNPKSVYEKAADPGPAGTGGAEPDSYVQLRKNTVRAENQVEVGTDVFLENPDGTGLRVMFLGNSITLHGILPSIGWNHFHGMAASSKEKDYVHRIEKKILEQDPDAVFCICQAAEWERNYRDPSGSDNRFEAARAFAPDILIMRLIENCPADDFRRDTFKANLKEFLSYLDAAGKAKILLTTGFWAHPGNEAIRELAREEGLPLAELEDLGEKPEMKALGLFAHSGVANHPGDLGMENIADRILKKLLPLL